MRSPKNGGNIAKTLEFANWQFPPQMWHAIFSVMKLRNLYISSGHNFFGHHGKPPGNHQAIEVFEVHCVTSRGIRGDRYFDHKENYKGQITFFAAEVFDEVCRALGVHGKSAAVLRRNVVTEGANLNALIGREFELQGVRFRGMEECSPCYWMNTALAPGAEKLMKGRGGLRAVILTDGYLRSETNESACAADRSQRIAE